MTNRLPIAVLASDEPYDRVAAIAALGEDLSFYRACLRSGRPIDSYLVIALERWKWRARALKLSANERREVLGLAPRPVE